MKSRLLMLLAGLAWWCWTHPPVLQVWTGPCEAGQLTFLRAQGAGVQPTEHGFCIAADAYGVRALAGWCAHLEKNRELARQNLANCQTLITQDGLPYRRRFASISPDGQSFVREDGGDYHWLYEPTHPCAVQDGIYRGYVRMPNVNAEAERALLRDLEEDLPRYRKALDELNRMVDPGHRLVLDRPISAEQTDQALQMAGPSSRLADERP